MSAGLQGAIESAPVTRLHEHRSYDPADFAVPGGREEEWRFTPLRRLRGLHTDNPPVPSGEGDRGSRPRARGQDLIRPNGLAVCSAAASSRPTG